MALADRIAHDSNNARALPPSSSTNASGRPLLSAISAEGDTSDSAELVPAVAAIAGQAPMMAAVGDELEVREINVCPWFLFSQK